MYGTIIQDAYRKEEAKEIINALDDNFSPIDNIGWASAGLYCFWNYDTREILYIGLTLDFCQRFKQHNGFMKTTETGSKYKNIESYFEKHEKLGYSILAQSPFEQPVTCKNIVSLFGYDRKSLREFNNEKPKENLKLVEGICIEAYRRFHGSIPLWNKVEGSKLGRTRTTDGNYKLVEVFTTDTTSPLMSRFSLRELSKEPLYEGIEVFLHVARQYMLNMGLNYSESLKLLKMDDYSKRFEQIEEIDYFNRKLNI